ncbi:hypothetical protein SAMN03080615_00871 [Amphritea atlantica]|uniref:ArsR family transcriptional regulator n=1 Tax=Amphritea atlantica TaxID=355243 RepID=A0A1H9EGL2_9GAMM|nr:hypothetical protein [Amphritea atlantica]SEQ24403.1 hypothetical protein SAMN03080615_00871 [Amphritea atlantica]
MPFSQFEQEDRRLVLLRLLAEDADYKINSSILQRGLELYGHSVSRDKLHSEIAWLTEQDLVTEQRTGCGPHPARPRCRPGQSDCARCKTSGAGSLKENRYGR